MFKKVIMLAVFAGGFALGIHAQDTDDAYNVDATTSATAQKKSATTSTEERVNKFMDAVSRLHVGGYGEVAMSRNFYSSSLSRYGTNPGQFANDKSWGKFDIPHAVINIGYDFGKGWSLGMEIEYEHTGTGTSIEAEPDEALEYETETEKGGEVELEQFWINKEFRKWANIKVGHIIVPVGLNNAYHEPLNFFTVYRPEGEDKVLPSTWHDTGISFWGRYKDFKYQLMMVAGMNALQYTRDGWVHEGPNSAFEFKPAVKYGFAFRVDNYTIKGLRLGLSAYYGQGAHNNYPNDLEESAKYGKVKANTYIGSFDFTFNRFNWIVRGQADYGYVSDTPLLNSLKASYPTASNVDATKVGKNAVAIGIEAGYDIFSQIAKLRKTNQKMYIFGRFDHYNSYIPESSQNKYGYTRRNVWTVGLNYKPLKQIVVKAEYSKRCLNKPYNDEPSVNIGIAYQGWFF